MSIVIKPQLPIRQPSAAEIDALARTLWGEARGEGIQGMTAVACVIVNRVNIDLGNDGKPDWWGEGIESVCRARYQFSCWLPNDPNYKQMLAQTEADLLFCRARTVAVLAASGLLVDITGGATHYYAVNIAPPNWTQGATLTATIGRHKFYKGVR